MQRQVCIWLSANIRGYTVKIKCCNKCLVENINDNKTCLKFLTEDRFLQLIISPIGDEYYTVFYYNLDLCSACCYNLTFNFIKKANKNSNLNTFYLIDRIYGLKIDGRLIFTKT